MGYSGRMSKPKPTEPTVKFQVEIPAALARQIDVQIRKKHGRKYGAKVAWFKSLVSRDVTAEVDEPLSAGECERLLAMTMLDRKDTNTCAVEMGVAPGTLHWATGGNPVGPRVRDAIREWMARTKRPA